MKVYGYDITGPARGDLLATRVDANDLDYGTEALACEFGWEFVSRSFAAAKQALLNQMHDESADLDLIRIVRGMKASDVPEVEA